MLRSVSDISTGLDNGGSRSRFSRRAFIRFSAGAAVAVCVAARDRRISSVVSCACPTVSRIGTDRALAERMIAEFRGVGIIKDDDFPPSLEDWMAGFNQVYSLQWVAKLAPRPILIIHGAEDDIVPVESSRDLFHSAEEPKDMVIIQGAGHQLRLSERAMDAALNWLKARSLSRD